MRTIGSPLNMSGITEDSRYRHEGRKIHKTFIWHDVKLLVTCMLDEKNLQKLYKLLPMNFRFEKLNHH